MVSSIRFAAAALALTLPCLAQSPYDAAAHAQSTAIGFTPGSSLAPTSIWSDNFNRADAGTMGVDWVEQQGSHGIVTNTGYSIGTGVGWAQHATASIDYVDAKVGIDFLPKASGSNLIFVATMLGTGASASNVFLKVQDNNSDGLYDTIFYYRGVHGAGGTWNGTATGTAITPTASGRMTCYITDNGDTANVDIDNNFDGVVDNHSQKTGVLTYASSLGTGIGLGTYNNVAYDNWIAEDTSAPPPPVAYCTAGTTTNGCVPTIAGSSNPNVPQSNACFVTVSNVEGQQSGIIFYGVSGTVAVPWCSTGGNSFLCVKTPLWRTPVQTSGGTFGQCDGTLALDWNAYQIANPTAYGNPWAAGNKAYVQGWFRDPPSCKTTFLSEALELTYIP